ncbi:MAG: hypothetical protein HN377_11755 [Alphaproteobacteria bacterium]|jgi:hypothetical protein|nr:hypothetical protein [Alphaproteobacteria bacterium]MBT7942427.1 hypothetical protein [Alphaproteobacteria bacterium]
MMMPSRGPAPLPPPNRRSWFGARLCVASAHCRLADTTVRLLALLGSERPFSDGATLVENTPAKSG